MNHFGTARSRGPERTHCRERDRAEQSGQGGQFRRAKHRAAPLHVADRHHRGCQSARTGETAGSKCSREKVHRKWIHSSIGLKGHLLERKGDGQLPRLLRTQKSGQVPHSFLLPGSARQSGTAKRRGRRRWPTQKRTADIWAAAPSRWWSRSASVVNAVEAVAGFVAAGCAMTRQKDPRRDRRGSRPGCPADRTSQDSALTRPRGWRPPPSSWGW